MTRTRFWTLRVDYLLQVAHVETCLFPSWSCGRTYAWILLGTLQLQSLRLRLFGVEYLMSVGFMFSGLAG